jgi:Arc/MetJ family transcription regulator
MVSLKFGDRRKNRAIHEYQDAIHEIVPVLYVEALNLIYNFKSSGVDGFLHIIAMCINCIIFTHKKRAMRTNIELDDELVQQAIKLSRLRTKKEVVQEALKNYVAWMKKKELLNLRGRVTWEGDLKEMRSV